MTDSDLVLTTREGDVVVLTLNPAKSAEVAPKPLDSGALNSRLLEALRNWSAVQPYNVWARSPLSGSSRRSTWKSAKKTGACASTGMQLDSGLVPVSL